jgi:O-antigen/teichoic acid export membrane protein
VTPTKKYKAMMDSEFVRNSAKLLSAGVIAQAIGILIYPILTRIYAPEDFGLLNLFQSIAGVLIILSTAEYQYAILLPKEDAQAKKCLHVGTTVLIGTFALCALSIPFAQPIAQQFNAPELARWYWTLPLLVLFSGGWSLLNYWHTRNKNYTLASTYQISKSLLNAGLKWGLGIIGFIKGGLIIATVVSAILSFLLNLARSMRKYKCRLASLLPKPDKQTAVTYQNFPKFALPRTLFNYVSANLPFFLLTPFFGLEETGFFGMALTLAFTPISLINGSIYQVLFQQVSEKVNNKQSIIGTFRNFYRRVCLVVPPIGILLFILLPFLTKLLLGEAWNTTADYIRMMLPWLFASLLAGPTCFITDIFMKQKETLYVEFTLLIVRAASLTYGIMTHDIHVAILGFCGVTFLIFSAQVFWFYSIAKKYESTLPDKSEQA